MAEQTQAAKQKSSEELVGTGVKIAALGMGVYVLFQGAKMFLGTKRPSVYTSAPMTPSRSTSYASGSVGTRTVINPWVEGTFPLRFGATRNNKVVRLQRALITRGVLAPTAPGGTTNADGDFGPLTSEAIRAAGFPNSATSVSEDVYSRILSGSTSTVASGSVGASTSNTTTQVIKSAATAFIPGGALLNLFSGVPTGPQNPLNF